MTNVISKSCVCGFVVSRKRGLRKLDGVYSWVEVRLAAHESKCTAPALYAACTKVKGLLVCLNSISLPAPVDDCPCVVCDAARSVEAAIASARGDR